MPRTLRGRGSRKWGISESKKARDAIVENSENLYDFKSEYTKVIFNAKSKIRNIRDFKDAIVSKNLKISEK